MEGGTIAVTVFLTALIMPIGIGAAVLGLLTIVKGLGGFRNPHHGEFGAAKRDLVVSGRAGSSVLERIGAGLCLTVAVFLILMLGDVGRSGRATPWTALLLVLIALLPAPVVVWNTRYRTVAEGLATVAIAGIAILSGFSIGFAFVPVVVLMIWLCVKQLLQSKPRLENDRPSG